MAVNIACITRTRPSEGNASHIARGIDRRETAGTQLNILVGPPSRSEVPNWDRGGTSVTRIDTHHTQPVAKEWTRTGARRRCHHRRDCPARRTLRCRGERNGAQRPLAAGKPFSTNSSSAITIFWDGVSPRPRVQLFFGQVPAELLERAESSVLFVASEPSILTPEPRSKTSAAKDHPMREADAAVH